MKAAKWIFVSFYLAKRSILSGYSTLSFAAKIATVPFESEFSVCAAMHAIRVMNEITDTVKLSSAI